jgi:Sulfotransferase family
VNARPLWIFLHIPKCGGTTFKAHVERHLTIEETFFEFSNWGRQFRAERGLPDFADRPDEQRARAEILAGHQLGYGIHRLVPGERDTRYFTVLRDPAERCVSLYNFRWSRGHASDDFGEWYDAWYRPNHSDYQTKFLAERLYTKRLPARPVQRLAMAQRLLELCWFVTTTECWNEGLDHLFAAMGLPGDWQHYRKAGDSIELPTGHPAQGEAVTRRFSADNAVRTMILADSPMDVGLLDWVRANRWKWA